MKRKIVISLCFILCMFLSACSTQPEQYNLIIKNNSTIGFKTIAFYEENSSGGVCNADNSLIKPGEEVHMNIQSNKFSLNVTDEHNNEFKSEEFHIDFNSTDKKVYNISVNRNASGKLEFILK